MFFKTSPPPLASKPIPLNGAPPLPLKNEAHPIWKTPTPLKREVPFHEMIPRKNTLNNNLKSSKNPSKIWVKKFIFSKFASLQAYSRQLYYQMNSTTGIFNIILSPPPHASPMYWLKPPQSNFEEHCPSMEGSPPCSQHLYETLGLLWRGRGSLKSKWK